MSILVAIVGLIHCFAEKRSDQWLKWQLRLWKCYTALLLVDWVCIFFWMLFVTH